MPAGRSCSPIRRDEGDQRERNVAAVFRGKEKLPLTGEEGEGRRTCTPTAKSTALLPARSILDGDSSAAALWQALSRVVAGGSCGRGKMTGLAMAWWLGERENEARGRRDGEGEGRDTLRAGEAHLTNAR